jgi:hypothetical protein
MVDRIFRQTRVEDLDPGQRPVQGRLGVVGDQDRGDLEQGVDLDLPLHGDLEM